MFVQAVGGISPTAADCDISNLSCSFRSLVIFADCSSHRLLNPMGQERQDCECCKNNEASDTTLRDSRKKKLASVPFRTNLDMFYVFYCIQITAQACLPCRPHADCGHSQGEGGASRDRHLDHQQEHLSHPQDHRPWQHGAARALHPQANRLHAAGRRGPRRQSKNDRFKT